MPTSTQIQEFVDDPNETLDVEYKAWLDLGNDNEARADLARHLCALANHGGGSLVFVFTDEMKFAGANPHLHVTYDRDLVSSIVKRYLEPSFQCDVQIVRSTTGNDHPIIIIPPHGAAPICARASGPERNGKPQGIVQGTHYIRKPGPESAPILTSAEWAPLIRRCAMHERSAILAAVDSALRGAQPMQTTEEALKKWHDAARSIFRNDMQATNPPDYFLKGTYQFSYLIDRSDDQKLNLNEMLTILREANAEVEDLVRTGWSMFYPFNVQEIAPYFTTDSDADGSNNDFLETKLLNDTRSESRGRFSDMWRISPSGKATIIRNYWEDDPEMNQQQSLSPGTWFSPNMMVRALAEIIRHARAISERFDSATAVTFRCEWRGLERRFLHHPLALWRTRTPARTDSRIVTGSWPITSIAGNWPEIVAELGAPVIRLFTSDFVLTDQWVRGQTANWRF